MKKIITLCVAAMTAVTMMAADYHLSLGLVGGLGLGVQFKDMVTPHFTIIEEFGYFTCTSNGGYGGAIDNLVLAYQAKAAEGRGILLDYYVGGQIKAGYTPSWGPGGTIGFGAAAGIEACMKNAPIAFSFDFRPGYACVMSTGLGGADLGLDDEDLGDLGGLGGLGAMAGIGGVGPGGLMISHIFDYSFNLAVRYKF